MNKKKITIIMLVLLAVLLISNLGAQVHAEELDLGQDEEEATLRNVNGKILFVGKQAGRRLDIKEAPAKVKAIPSKQNIRVDGELTSFRAYSINGNNYFMLRDIAYIFKNTIAEFEVEWDNVKRAINVNTGKTYTGGRVGFEMKTPHVEENGTKNTGKIYKNGEEAFLLGYVIQGNTYFKLRDLGDDFNFQVDWDPHTNTVIIESDPKREEKEEELAYAAKKVRQEAELEAIREQIRIENQRDMEGYREIAKSEEEKAQVEKGLEVIGRYKNRYGGKVSLELDEVLVKQNPYTGSDLRRQLEIIVELINAERAQLGRQALILDDKLIELSEFKAQDMCNTNIFSHTGTYGEPIDLAKMFNVSEYIGENISKGYTIGANIFEGFYNSPGHYANMVNPKFKKIGIGLKPIEGTPWNYTLYWCAMNLTD